MKNFSSLLLRRIRLDKKFHCIFSLLACDTKQVKWNSWDILSEYGYCCQSYQSYKNDFFSLADKAGETSARKVILEEKLNTFFLMTEYAGLQRSDLAIEELLLRTKSPVL